MLVEYAGGLTMMSGPLQILKRNEDGSVHFRAADQGTYIACTVTLPAAEIAIIAEAALDAEKEKVAALQSKVHSADTNQQTYRSAGLIAAKQALEAEALVTTLQANLAEARRVIEPLARLAKRIPHDATDGFLAEPIFVKEARAAAAFLAAHPTPEATDGQP